MTLNTKWLGSLLTNHVVMLALWAGALALPLLITAIFGGALNLDNIAPIMIAACCGLLVQLFWAVGSYLLISKEWSASVIAFAAATICANTALAILSSMLLLRAVPDIAFDVLGPMILASCSLYFIAMALIAEKVSTTRLRAVVNFLLVFYWPVTLSFISARLRTLFEAGEQARNS